MFTHTGKILIAAAVIGITLGVILGLSGCTRMMDIDEALWAPLTQTQAQKDAGEAPPILAIIAGGLSLVGFGGMAAWIRRNKKHADKNNRKDTPA